MKNECSWEPIGECVLVEPEEIEEVTKGGIILCSEGKERERVGMTWGTLIAVGDDAWHDSPNPQAKVGDVVMFARFAGWAIEEGEGEKKTLHRMMWDKDLFCKKRKKK